MTSAILFCVAVFATSVSYGGQEAPGVAGVDVVLKQNPNKHAVTDGHGNFALEALPPGSYTLSFRAPRAKAPQETTRNKIIVATSYSIKIEGTKRPVNQSGLTSDKLIAGFDVAVEVGSGAKIRGQVVAPGAKRWVWISKAVGSNMPGHWAEEASNEVYGYNITEISPSEMLRNSGK